MERRGGTSARGPRAFRGDALDQDDVLWALETFRPEVVVNQLTALPASADLRNFRKVFEQTNRLRTVGGRNLIDAARATGARRLVAPSFCGWPYARTGAPAKREGDRLDPDPPAEMRDTLGAIRQLEADATSAPGLEGVVLRYGMFYGPGTSIARSGPLVADLRRRRVPLVGKGTGVFSSSTSTMRLPPPWRRSKGMRPASSMSSTTIQRRCASGCRFWRAQSARNRRSGCRIGSQGLSCPDISTS